MKEKEEKLLKRPVEKDTRILFKKIVWIGDYQALYERWVWDGITASSIVFLYEDVGSRGQEKTCELVREILKLPSDERMTFSVTLDHVFVNFAFETD